MFGSFGGGNEIYTGDIGHSLRFRASNNGYLSKSYIAGTNPADSSLYKKFISIKVKRSKLGSLQHIFTHGTDANNRWQINFDTNDKLALYAINTSAVKLNLTSDMVFRDPTNHVHIDILQDVTQASAGSRTTAWVNGTQITFTGTTATQNDAVAGFLLTPVGGAWNARVGNEYVNGVGVNQFDGYLSRFCVVDNPSGVTPSSFGYLNTEINEWVSKSQSAVKAVVDAGGTNSFMLDFDDATSLTTLGYDKSSKGNNWTLNNVSLTAGATYDWMSDVPGNSYATLNPLMRYAANIPTLSDGNLKTLTTPSNTGTSPSTHGMSSGKWYAEFTPTANSGVAAYMIGVLNSSANLASYVGIDSNGWAYYNDGTKYTNNTATAYGATFTTNDVIGVALDMDAGTLTFYKNGVSQGQAYSGLSGQTLFFAVSDGGGSHTATFVANFGQRPFAYTPPTGFKALCQANMPDPAILNPEKHFDVLLHTGNAAPQNVTGTQFQPDLVWIKGRNTAYDHHLFDVARTLGNKLSSNLAAAESASGLTGYLSNGFSLSGAYSGVNGSGATFVDWLWKAGGAAVTNNNGSISSQVSANVLAGFSIVTATSNGANPFTVGHGLGVSPKLVIVKNRDLVDGWYVWHSAFPSTTDDYIQLNTTAARASAIGIWGAGVTSTTLGIRGSSIAANGQKIVAYCFAEIPGYSKVGSYTGNGSVDGPFVYCGFKPKYVLIKRTDAASDWQIWDTARSPYNESYGDLKANLANAEAGASFGDFLANGFKVRNTSYNASGGTYIFYAIADVPAKYALAR